MKQDGYYTRFDRYEQFCMVEFLDMSITPCNRSSYGWLIYLYSNPETQKDVAQVRLDMSCSLSSHLHNKKIRVPIDDVTQIGESFEFKNAAEAIHAINNPVSLGHS